MQNEPKGHAPSTGHLRLRCLDPLQSDGLRSAFLLSESQGMLLADQTHSLPATAKETSHCVTINAQEEGGRLETERNLLPLSCG